MTMRAAFVVLALTVLFSAGGVRAQSTATPVLPGLLVNSGCNPGQIYCWAPYSSTNPLPVTPTSGSTFNENWTQTNSVAITLGTGAASANTPRVAVASDSSITANAGTNLNTSALALDASVTAMSAKLPATLGAKTGALSLSVVPNTDTAFPISAAALPLPSGAATSALQTTGNTALTTINTTLGSPFQAGGSIGNTTFAVTQATASNLNAQVQGVDSAGATVTAKPMTIGGKDGSNNAQTIFAGGQGDAFGSVNALAVDAFAYGSNGTTKDLLRTIQGASAGTGIGVLGMGIIPNSSANVAIAEIVSTAAESSHILKASAGNLYRVAVTTGASAGYLLVFNATSAPGDGAVTPILCRAVAANSSIEADHATIPDRYSTGITAVFSTTGCFTKTASATATFEGAIE